MKTIISVRLLSYAARPSRASDIGCHIWLPSRFRHIHKAGKYKQFS